MGKWLGKFGEAIYDTRPWVTFGEGPTRMKKGGHFVGKVDYAAKDVRFTTKGDVLYAIFLGAPKGAATIASLAKGSGNFAGEAKGVTLLGRDGEMKFLQDDKGLHVKLPAAPPDPNAIVLKIEGLKIAGFKPDLSIRFKDGKAVLDASRAELHGPTIATENKDNGRANIGYWDKASATASWEVRFPQAGTYEVRARIAAQKQASFSVRVAGKSLAAKAPVTGAWDKFEDVRLGTIQVAQPGRQEVKILPDKSAWAAINLSWLELKPAK